MAIAALHDVLAEGVALELEELAVGARDRAGAPRLLVEQRKLAEVLSDADVAERDLGAPAFAIQEDADHAVLDEEHRVSGFALLERSSRPL